MLKRENLHCLFILLDARLEPQKIDLEFIQWSGEKEIPLCLVFTKADKLTKNLLNRNVFVYKTALLKMWEDLPAIIITSSTVKTGKEELLSFIEKALADQS